MTERDNLIAGKVKDLTAKKERLVEKIKNLPAYKTSLRIGGVNMRELTTKKDVFSAFKDVIEEHKAMKEFESEFGTLEDRRIYGYEYEEWVDDVSTICKKIELTGKLNRMIDAVSDLDDFVSDETKETIKFNSLLDDIADL